MQLRRRAEKRLLGHARVGEARRLCAARSRGGALHTPLRPDLACCRARGEASAAASASPFARRLGASSTAFRSLRQERHALRFIPRARHAPLRRRSARAEELAREALAGGRGTRTRSSDCRSRSWCCSCIPQQGSQLALLLSCCAACRARERGAPHRQGNAPRAACSSEICSGARRGTAADARHRLPPHRTPCSGGREARRDALAPH
ncbi:hypothetical protein FA09DRAFT_264635 [Tilletiopsis washingtonensis]|jgi:hypothetical protein|uniref:Uncharacterized protein n=1 Tax=Tilletiopsis washingtonensis TaxID=58919 RepID=A0A316Z9S4_9BASI|nr:hypothetical protein FA09DRAFT_264635 [Tilletiopsis washingtonensis]PWN98450.1 hypothetical protein FA09DRAFT_264635 [Tilletiopsis washingtonensis]